MAISCMRNASGDNYRNSSFIVDVAKGQIPRSTERISGFVYFLSTLCLSVHFCMFSLSTKNGEKR